MGFAPADWALFVLTAALLLAVYAWRPRVRRLFAALAEQKRACMVSLFLLPIAMRLLLLPHHPVPTPDIYDEFAQLLLADTLLHGRLANPRIRCINFSKRSSCCSSQPIAQCIR